MNRFVSLVLALVSFVSWASAEAVLPTSQDLNEVPAPVINPVLSIHSPQATISFSGSVSNENAEQYSYYFSIQRNQDKLHGVAILVDNHTKEMVLYEEESGTVNSSETERWQVGHLFLRFNPITSSWLFGVKNKEKRGFNFKIDMLGQPETATKVQYLRPGVAFLINQTGRLNGHLQLDVKEQFVTASKAWLRQIWLSKPQLSNHLVTAILCNFNDQNSFYSVNLAESDTLKGTIAGWRDEQGNPIIMSQFVDVQKQSTSEWLMHILTPKINLSLNNILLNKNTNEHLVAGFTQGDAKGFCTISRDEFIGNSES